MAILSNRRKHLTPPEVEVLLKTCKDHRNHTMILLAYRHGMRVSELTSLEWNPNRPDHWHDFPTSDEERYPLHSSPHRTGVACSTEAETGEPEQPARVPVAAVAPQ